MTGIHVFLIIITEARNIGRGSGSTRSVSLCRRHRWLIGGCCGTIRNAARMTVGSRGRRRGRRNGGSGRRGSGHDARRRRRRLELELLLHFGFLLVVLRDLSVT